MSRIEMMMVRRNLLTCRDRLSVIRSEIKFRKLMLALKAGFNPDQPRATTANGQLTEVALSTSQRAEMKQFVKRNTPATRSLAISLGLLCVGPKLRNDMRHV